MTVNQLLRATSQDATTHRFTLCLFLILLGGCGVDSDAPDGGPLGASETSPLLEPFAGTWAFDFEGTLEAQRAAGVDEQAIEQMRKLYSENPLVQTWTIRVLAVDQVTHVILPPQVFGSCRCGHRP